jgi:hypothetical protein
MSSLQKFHRRTNPGVAPGFPYSPIGNGNATVGFWLGTAGDGISKMIVAPKSTEIPLAWGSYGTTRSTVAFTDGLANTNTLYAFGSAAHPAAYYCKSLTTGGYNTWYMPARGEFSVLFTNKGATPFSTSNSFDGGGHWSSTENTSNKAFTCTFFNNNLSGTYKKSYGGYMVRAVRRA